MPSRMSPLDAWTISVTGVLTNQKGNAALVALRLRGSRKGRSVDMAGHPASVMVTGTVSV
jgi:hypothetical protein